MKMRHKISLLGLLLAAVALLSSPVVHAQINTGIQYGSATGLGGGDIRTIVGRIIQVFLGILGVVALVLIIYAGWLWMTAGGDDEKVTQAKKIMAQAVIGLAIILCSFAITSYVVSQLVAATTGENGGNGGGGGGGGGSLGSGQFTVQSITPPGGFAADFKWPKNSQIRVVLRNGDPDPATVPDSISVSANGAPVSGAIAVEGNVLVFAATAKCVENPSYTCLPGNTAISVAVAPTLKSTTGKTLTCGLCSASFSTSDLIDTRPPTVSIVSPIDGASVSVDSFVPVIADPHDDFAVASVEFFENGASLGSTGDPWQVDWDTTGFAEGATVTLAATATDAVGNTGLAQPVTVTVRPAHCFDNAQDNGETGLNCGDGCGACGGGSCSQASDCASGLCVSGKCVNRPRIDSVTPLAGGPGTLVSIKGASFGAAPGEVMFLGAATAGDEKVAAPCAPSAWTDSQIVVGVPEGAVSGPLQVTNRDNYSDRTDDDFGNAAISNFTVNTAVVPGICTLTPNFGPTGTSVVVSGNGFGGQGAGSVAMAGRTATVELWSGTQITMTTPNLLGGTWPVTVTAANTDSNSVGFTVPNSVNSAPHLLSIDPDSGPIGQYVTLTGNNFGTSPGTVEFISGSYSAFGGVDFPPACGNAYWTDTSATVKVPAGLPMGGVDVKLTRPGPVASDNTLPFTIVSGNPSAGICRINPTSGPVGTGYEIDGERLGNDQGNVVFRNNVSSLITSWNDSRVSGAVPARATTGAVTAVSALASVSNPLNFEVADCRTARVCSGSEECCGDGACRLPNADGSSGCQAMHLGASYRYRFSTGDIPVAPAVVEEISCSARSQSPSPYKDVIDACANSVGSVRFTIPMNPATLKKSNFKMVDCGSTNLFDAASCASEVNGSVTAFGAGQTLDDGMEFDPASGFKPNEWYQGTISKAVTSAANVPMDDDYVWHFRVRNSPDPCRIASVTVSPEQNTLTDIYSDAADHDTNENITWSAYKANPADDVCNVLDCTPYAWNWSAGNQTNAVGIVNPLICRPEVRALAETPVATPATITATAENKTGTGELTIKFAPPRVIDKWPACQAACLNAQVAASFNVAVKNISNQTVKLFTCNNETCLAPTEVKGYTVSTVDNGTEHLAVIEPPGANGLAPNQFYRVVVLGGPDGVLSLPGAELVGTNYVYGADQIFSYSWTFRTSGTRCTVDHVDMSPESIYTKVIGSYHSVTAVPVSAPDSCSAKGERLDDNGLGLLWSVSPDPGAAALFTENGKLLDVSPLASSYATSVCLNSGSAPLRSVCGNGIVENGQGDPKKSGSEGGEECDLGALNGQKGSGCSANCLLMGGGASCGNGAIDSYKLGDGSSVQEQCDLGAANDKPGATGSGSGCSSTCLREGSDSTTPGSACGNGDLADAEQCDDGNAIPGDGCSSDCLDEGSLPGPFSVCGNSQVEAGEDCDLGAANGKTGSGCSASCLLTGTSACTVKGQSNCCGNGVQDVGEALNCDGNWNSVTNQPNIAEGCDKSCRHIGASMSYNAPSVCGDAQIGAGESIDPGALKGGIDATQYAQAVGLGTTLNADNEMISTITAATGGKNGQAQFALQCGFADDAACAAVDPRTARGDNSCCYLRPNIVTMTPQGPDICRNPLIQVEFDQPMDEASFAGNFNITEPVPAGGCPAAKTASANFFKNIFAKIHEIAAKALAYVTGRPAGAASATCAVPGTVSVETSIVDKLTGVKHSFATFKLSAALDPKVTYTVTLNSSIKTVNGIPAAPPAPPWTFTTGPDICTLDAVNVAPTSYFFSSQYSSNVVDPNSSATFTATTVHLDATGAPVPIAPIPGTYAWNTVWTVSTEISTIIGDISGGAGAINLFPSGKGATPVSGARATVGVLAPDNGQGSLAATATITDDTVLNPSTKGSALSGASDLTIMICNDPWPARKADHSWAPAQNSTYNYSFYYCKDAAASATGELPALNETPASPKNLQAPVRDEYLYTYANVLGSEGIGIRVATNPLHLSAAEWYLSQGFKGGITPVKVDGYDAVSNGSTIYVDAPALDMPASATTTVNYTNIYILSSSVGAGAETQNIFGQIVKNFRFAANIDPATKKLLYSDLNICAKDAAASCSSDLDCAGACVSSACSNDGGISCKTDSDCSFGICYADRSKIRRDVKRLADLRLIAEAASKAKDATGVYPQLPSGSFVPGVTVSTWPSWNKEFAQELGGSPPLDPINKMAACPAGADYEAGTCWSPSKRSAVCPAGSHVYMYNMNGFNASTDGYIYSYSPETAINYLSNCANGLTQASCEADPLCRWSNFNGPWICESRVGNFCGGGAALSATGAVCGDGTITAGVEQCEKSVAPTQTVACGANGAGTEVDACGADCRWIKGACAAPKCGNGTREGKEVCDQGPLNGTYGHCNAACTGIGKSCGDLNVDQGESCDLGSQNGVYNSKCSFDCHSKGEYCGDNIVEAGAGEDCDGNIQTSSGALVGGAVDLSGSTVACGVSNGYQTSRTRSCGGNCKWLGWGPCLPAGSCGNNVKDGNEQCDGGASNSDTGACTTACKLNVCGDAKVYSGREQCDEGAGNIDPTDTVTIGRLKADCSLQSCYYCTNACIIKAVSGPYCGDELPSPLKQCDAGANNVDPKKLPYCSDNTGATCNRCSTACQNVTEPYCGDKIVNGAEGCDAGSLNGDPSSGCNATCSCTADVIVSDASTMVGGAPAVVQKPVGGWATLGSAQYIWNFDESNAANEPANWATSDVSVTFTKTFTLTHPTAMATLQMTSDNMIDSVSIDGIDITSRVPNGPPNFFGTVFSVYVTDELKTGLTHTLTIRAHNVANPGQNSVQNPAMLIYEIVSSPNCNGNAVAYAPPPVSIVPLPPPPPPPVCLGSTTIVSGPAIPVSVNADMSNASNSVEAAVLPGWTPVPGTKAIWNTVTVFPTTASQTVYFQTSFKTNYPLSSGILQMVVDDQSQIFIDGNLIGETLQSDWYDGKSFNIAGSIAPGNHTLKIKATNNGNNLNSNYAAASFRLDMKENCAV